MTEIELKACPTPWCDGIGGEPYVFERRFDAFGVYCPTCSVSTPYFKTAAEGIECWNTRPEPPLHGYAEGVKAAAKAAAKDALERALTPKEPQP